MKQCYPITLDAPSVPRALICPQRQPYAIAAGGSHLAVTLIEDRYDRRADGKNWLLRVFDLAGKDAFKAIPPTDPSWRIKGPDGSSRLARPSSTKWVAVSSSEPLVAVSGMYRVTIYNVKIRKQIFAFVEEHHDYGHVAVVEGLFPWREPRSSC